MFYGLVVKHIVEGYVKTIWFNLKANEYTICTLFSFKVLIHFCCFKFKNAYNWSQSLSINTTIKSDHGLLYLLYV